MSSPELLARIERDHQNAARVHQEASDKASAIEQRLEAIQSRMSEISAARVAGTATAEESDELVLLTHDKEALKKMDADAQTAVKSAGDDVHAIAIGYSDALTAHKRDQAQLELLALRQKANEIDQMLCRAIAETHRAGKAVGNHSLQQSWQPSQALTRIIHFNVVPGEVL